MAGRYFDEDLAWLIQLRDKRRQQIADLDSVSSSVGAAGYSDSQTNLSLSDLTRDLQELSFEIKRQQDKAAGTSTRPTCSFTDFSADCER